MNENKDIKELAKKLCEKSTCHYKCPDTDKCIVEEEAELLINENESNNFAVKSNKQIEEMAKACPFYDDGFCNLLEYHSEKCNMNCDLGDLIKNLYNEGWRKQSKGKWIYHECVSSFDGTVSGYSCSCCNAFVDDEVFEAEEFHKNYCGNCGAKMKGGEE